MAAKRVLNVGQCLADHQAITRAIQRHFDAEIVSADTADEALARLRQEAFALVLVNRVLDADGSSGLELIKQLKANTSLRLVPVMLVSNYAEAQQQAVAAGAVPGFGKTALGQPEMIEPLKPFLLSGK